ncbi:hypothetical protein AIY97_16020 [Salmonella enterica subsp. enterica serovar Typhimurium]|nr:hypothetical protein AIY97_16020 [Salmonella enterica subsp. enterica serovar Typhimurium]
MMSLWDALRMNMMISYQELVRTFLSKAPDNNDLLTLYHSISSLGWPTQGYPYLSKSTSSGGMYCGVDENTKSQNCAIKPAGSAGYATCVE